MSVFSRMHGFWKTCPDWPEFRIWGVSLVYNQDFDLQSYFALQSNKLETKFDNPLKCYGVKKALTFYCWLMLFVINRFFPMRSTWGVGASRECWRGVAEKDVRPHTELCKPTSPECSGAVLGDTEVLCYKKQAVALRVFVFVSRPVYATSNEDLLNNLLAWWSRVDLDSPSLLFLLLVGACLIYTCLFYQTIRV